MINLVEYIGKCDIYTPIRLKELLDGDEQPILPAVQYDLSELEGYKVYRIQAKYSIEAKSSFIELTICNIESEDY